jgi:uncharacterized protein YndB with AHSA1/START domain
LPATVTERLRVDREVLVAAAPDTVWELLTDPHQITRWMGVDAAFDLSPGGDYRVEVVPGHVVTGEFVEVDPPQLLSHTWGWEIDDEAVSPGSTIVTYELHPTATGTLLRVTHRCLPDLESAGSHSRGWGHYLERLTALAAGGAPGPDPWVSDLDLMRAELGARTDHRDLAADDPTPGRRDP